MVFKGYWIANASSLAKRGFTEEDFQKALQCCTLVHLHFLYPVSEPNMGLQAQPCMFPMEQVASLMENLDMPWWQQVFDPSLSPPALEDLPFPIASRKWIKENVTSSAFCLESVFDTVAEYVATNGALPPHRHPELGLVVARIKERYRSTLWKHFGRTLGKYAKAPLTPAEALKLRNELPAFAEWIKLRKLDIVHDAMMNNESQLTEEVWKQVDAATTNYHLALANNDTKFVQNCEALELAAMEGNPLTTEQQSFLDEKRKGILAVLRGETDSKLRNGVTAPRVLILLEVPQFQEWVEKVHLAPVIDLWEDNQEIPESLWEEVRYWAVNWRINSSVQTRQPERDAQWLRGYSALLDAVELPKSTDNHPNFEKTTFGSWWNCQKRSMRDKSVGRKIVNTTMTDYQLDLLAEIPIVIVMAWMEEAKVAAIYRASKEGKEPTAEQISAVEKAAEKMMKTGAVNDVKWNKKLEEAIKSWKNHHTFHGTGVPNGQTIAQRQNAHAAGF